MDNLILGQLSHSMTYNLFAVIETPVKLSPLVFSIPDRTAILHMFRLKTRAREQSRRMSRFFMW
jgi:hypothetical protein